MAFFRVQPVDRQPQPCDSPLVVRQPFRGLLPCRQHRLGQAHIGRDGLVGQWDLVALLSLCSQLRPRPMTGKAALAKPAQHIPAHTPAGHADRQCGCGAEGASPALARGIWTTHQMVHHLRRPRQRPQMMRAVVAHGHVTVTNRTRAVLDIQHNPCECRPRGPTIRHGRSIPVLKSVDVERREPTIA
jgi:hypothetical protein